MQKKLTQTQLKKDLNYNPETGLFTRLKDSRNKKYLAGSVTGCSKHHRGYVTISLHSKYYAAHRLAFLYMTGEFPLHGVDHINHKVNDTRWDNLRDVTHSMNCKNQTRSILNKSGGNWSVPIEE